MNFLLNTNLMIIELIIEIVNNIATSKYAKETLLINSPNNESLKIKFRIFIILLIFILLEIISPQPKEDLYTNRNVELRAIIRN